MRNKIYVSTIGLLLLCLVACSNHPLPYTFLIPANYEGILRVVCNEKCGIKPNVENGRQILEFQKNGLLIVSAESFNGGEDYYELDNNGQRKKVSDGKMIDEYYLVDEKGKRTKLMLIPNAKEKISDVPCIVAGPTTVAGYTYHNSEVQVKGIVYKDFFLYNKNTTAIKEDPSLQKMNLLTKAIVNDCRAGK